MIIDVCCRWPGSTHDATMFANSTLLNKIENGDYGTNSVILGDSAYALKYYICKPLEHVDSDEDDLYQTAQIKTRNVAERTYGVLKRRFPCLQLGIHYKLAKVQDVILSCCILHNMIREENGLNDLDPVEEWEVEKQFDLGMQIDEIHQNQAPNRRTHIRNFLIENYF